MDKKSGLQDLTEGSLLKKIFLFSMPLVISNLLQVLFNMADVAVVGRFAGAGPLGSVGSTSNLVFMFIGVLIGVSGGINVLVAHHYGAKDEKRLRKTIHTSFIISLIFGLALLFVGVVFSEGILRLLNTREELLEGAVLYMRIYCLGFPATAIYNFGSAVLSAVGDTRRPLLYLSISGVINVLLNLFLVIGYGMGAEGVAIASAVSQYVVGIWIILAMIRSKEVYALRISEMYLDRETVRAVLKIGVPAGMQNVIFQMANLCIQAGINSFSSEMVAGNAAASNTDLFVFQMMAAFYTACGSFMGQNYGAGKKKRVFQSFLICLLYSFAIGLGMGILLACFGDIILLLFTKDLAVVEAGMYRLTILGLSICISALMDTAIAASRALGKSFVPTVIVLLGSCVFRIVWVYTIFEYFRTIESLYLLYAFSWGITGIAEIIYFFRVFRKTEWIENKN